MADEWACAFPSWHSIPALRSATLRSIVLPLPHEFVSFLLADGVFVGDASNAVSALLMQPVSAPGLMFCSNSTHPVFRSYHAHL
eukprot:1047054-Pelagomonas_calceolata.AAC.7